MSKPTFHISLNVFVPCQHNQEPTPQQLDSVRLVVGVCVLYGLTIAVWNWSVARSLYTDSQSYFSYLPVNLGLVLKRTSS